ncbi:carbohydrate binding domain-containing protein, partial [Paraburkholderia tropica]|uniref:carbohydrate binding domain-containing protein n=1 Tax=Paraburkholderia tropica TaxID=92647 RepID=UPI00301899CF
WSDAAGSISVGGRNLLVKTNQGITNWDWTMSNGDKSVEEVNIDGIRAVKLTKGTKTANTGWNYIQYRGLLRKLIRPNTKYTLSFDVKPSVDVSFSATLMRGNRKAELTDTVLMNKALANQWTKVSCVLTSKETLPGDLNQVVYLAGMPTTNGNWVIIK